MSEPDTPAFVRYLGIDYSGAATADSSLKGLRVYRAERAHAPAEVPPPPGPKRYWTRRGLADWLVATLREPAPTLVGIDHAFAFPLHYFERHRLPPDWPAFLDDFQAHWPTDAPGTTVDLVRDGSCGNAAARSGDRRWRRLCEVRSGSAKSVFHFDVQGQVAKSTHAGLPWLRDLRRRLGKGIHCWPFDGWHPPRGRSVVAEVYPRLWKQLFAVDARTPDQHDAYTVAAWLQRSDRSGTLSGWFTPQLDASERRSAAFEGWIFGIR